MQSNDCVSATTVMVLTFTMLWHTMSPTPSLIVRSLVACLASINTQPDPLGKLIRWTSLDRTNSLLNLVQVDTSNTCSQTFSAFTSTFNKAKKTNIAIKNFIIKSHASLEIFAERCYVVAIKPKENIVYLVGKTKMIYFMINITSIF